MKKDLLTVLIVNFNSSEFIEVSLYALEKLTKNPYMVFVLDNGSKVCDYRNLKRICSKYGNVFLERKETSLRGGIAHGTALNYLVEKVDTPYFSILDADATWSIKGWDEILISKINDKAKIIGTQAAGNKPKDFPLMFAIFFETETFKRLGIDFIPRDISSQLDTGWEIRQKYMNKGFKGEVLNLRATRTYKGGPLKEVICAEYYLEGISHNIASHFGMGSTSGAHK